MEMESLSLMPLRYTDFLSGMTAGLFGRTSPRLKEALFEAIQKVGTNLGGTTRHEFEYASLLCERFDLDRLHFADSGTEANIHAATAARRLTGRRKVIVFRGGYHGSVLTLKTSIGPNTVDPQDWILLQYNNVKGLEKALEKHSDIAAVLLEGVQGSGGGIPATMEFLNAIRSLSTLVCISPYPHSSNVKLT